MTWQVDIDTATLAVHLEAALRRFYGVREHAEDDSEPFNSILSDERSSSEGAVSLRFYCPHCGGAGPKRDKVKHSETCWYQAARSALYSYKRRKQNNAES